MPPKKTIAEMIKEGQDSVQQPPSFSDYQMPPGVPDAMTLQKSLQTGAAPGSSQRIKQQFIDPNSVSGANQQLQMVRDYNATAHKNAIQKIADTVADNIRASERTAQILQGTKYEGEEFFGGVIATEKKRNLYSPDDTNPLNQVTEVSHRGTPSGVPIETNVEYAQPPKYDPKFTTLDVSYKAPLPKDNGGVGNLPLTEHAYAAASFTADNKAATFTKQGANEFNPAVQHPFDTPSEYNLYADAGRQNIKMIDGRDPLMPVWEYSGDSPYKGFISPKNHPDARTDKPHAKGTFAEVSRVAAADYIQKRIAELPADSSEQNKYKKLWSALSPKYDANKNLYFVADPINIAEKEQITGVKIENGKEVAAAVDLPMIYIKRGAVGDKINYSDPRYMEVVRKWMEKTGYSKQYTEKEFRTDSNNGKLLRQQFAKDLMNNKIKINVPDPKTKVPTADEWTLGMKVDRSFADILNQTAIHTREKLGLKYDSTTKTPKNKQQGALDSGVSSIIFETLFTP